MQKLLILVSMIASLFLTGCSNDPIVARLPFVYKIDVQQGNVITQEQVNQLRVGMNPRQIQFLLGAPMVADPFHANRWDYYYELLPGSSGREPERQRVTLEFVDEQLATISGTMQPQKGGGSAPQRQVTVVVPYQEPETVGILTRFWRWITFQNKAET